MALYRSVIAHIWGAISVATRGESARFILDVYVWHAARAVQPGRYGARSPRTSTTTDVRRWPVRFDGGMAGTPVHARAVSLLIRHAAPATNSPNHTTALTTAYHGSWCVSGARAISETPYIGVQ